VEHQELLNPSCYESTVLSLITSKLVSKAARMDLAQQLIMDWMNKLSASQEAMKKIEALSNRE
jgi:hypothetical protein